MDTVLFNLHDVTLVMTVFLCILLSILLLVSREINKTSASLLALFLLAHALISLHELTYYGIQFRYTVFNISPNLFFIGSLFYCLDAVILYLYIKSVVYSDFKFKALNLLHLVPIVLYLSYLIIFYYGLEPFQKKATIWEWRLTNSWHFVTVDALIKIVRPSYALGCILLISRYRNSLKESRSDIKAINLDWLKLLVVCFLLVMVGDVCLSLIKLSNLFMPINESILVFVGVSSYYATFLLVVALLVYSIAKLPTIKPVLQKKYTTATDTQSAFKPNFIARIENLMQAEKPYMISDITIEILAEKLDVSVKELSMTMNRYFQMNFYEYINLYRVEESKVLLLRDKDKSITDIFYEVGFNSKSVFNTFFKKKEGITPSQYRKSALNN